MWRTIRVTDRSGAFEFAFARPVTASPAGFRLEIDRQRIKVGRYWWQVDRHKWIRSEREEWKSEASIAGMRPLDFKLSYDTAPPVYTFLLFAPALFGLLAAALVGGSGLSSGTDSRMLHKFVRWFSVRLKLAHRVKRSTSSLTPFSSSEQQAPPVKEISDAATNLYVFAGSAVWVVIIAWFAIGFVFSDLQEINLFHSTMRVPVVVPVAAFLGVLVFATTQLLELTKDGKTDRERETLFLELGNRVFIAPYVAIVAVLALPDTRAVTTTALIAFVTGLWIEPVLETIRTLTEALLPGKKKTESDTAAKQAADVAKEAAEQAQKAAAAAAEQGKTVTLPNVPPVPLSTVASGQTPHTSERLSAAALNEILSSQIEAKKATTDLNPATATVESAPVAPGQNGGAPNESTS